MPSAWACGRCKPAQPWSEQSTQLLKTLVLGKTISFRCHDLDRYDRHICDLALRTTANVQMVLAGVAWANRANPRYLRDSSVAAAADQARINRRGSRVAFLEADLYATDGRLVAQATSTGMLIPYQRKAQ